MYVHTHTVLYLHVHTCSLYISFSPISQMPRSCDELFIQKLYDKHNHAHSTHFSKPRTSRSAFQVRHYAGSVQYQSTGFVEKNSERVSEEHKQLLQSSKVRTYMYVHVRRYIYVRTYCTYMYVPIIISGKYLHVSMYIHCTCTCIRTYIHVHLQCMA